MADTQNNEGLNLTVLWNFVWNYQHFVISNDDTREGLEMQVLGDLEKVEEKQNLTNFIAFIAASRSTHHARLVAARGYSLYKESQGAPQEPVIASDPDLEIPHGHPNVEFPFAIGSMGYIPIIFMELYQIYAGKKANVDLDFDKIAFELSDAVVWSIINVFRLEGAVFEKADAGEWAGVSETMNQSLLLAGYGFDLINQLYFDGKAYLKNEAALDKITTEINECQKKFADLNVMLGDFEPESENFKNQLELYSLLVKKQKLRDKKSELFWRAGVWNSLYACSLVTGAALKLSASSTTYAITSGAVVSLGILFIVAGTAANQIKNWAVSCKEYNDAQKKYQEIKKIIGMLKMLKPHMLTSQDKKQLNFQLLEAGMDQLNDYSEFGLEKYITKQELLAEQEMRAANKKITLDSAWYCVTLTSLGCLTFATGPVGLAVFVFGLAGYSLIKYAYSCKEYYDEIKKCYQQDQYLSTLNNKILTNDFNQNEINLELIKLGMSEITDFSKTGIPNYIMTQSFIIEQKMNAANQKMGIESLWYALGFAILGGFIFGSNPIGLMVLVVSIIVYNAAKYLAKETTPEATRMPLITPKKSDTISASTNEESKNDSPQYSPTINRGGAS